MNDLLKAKQEAFDSYVYHTRLEGEHAEGARKARQRMLEINDEIRALERGLAEPIKVIYG